MSWDCPDGCGEDISIGEDKYTDGDIFRRWCSIMGEWKTNLQSCPLFSENEDWQENNPNPKNNRLQGVIK